MSWETWLVAGIAWFVGYVGGFARGASVIVKEQVAERFFNPVSTTPNGGQNR